MIDKVLIVGLIVLQGLCGAAVIGLTVYSLHLGTLRQLRDALGY